jgi:hypothetical protein
LTIYNGIVDGKFKCYTHSFSCDTLDEFDLHCYQLSHTHITTIQSATGDYIDLEYTGRTVPNHKAIDVTKTKVWIDGKI